MPNLLQVSMHSHKSNISMMYTYCVPLHIYLGLDSLKLWSVTREENSLTKSMRISWLLLVWMVLLVDRVCHMLVATLIYWLFIWCNTGLSWSAESDIWLSTLILFEYRNRPQGDLCIYHPQSNGLVERLNQTVQNTLMTTRTTGMTSWIPPFLDIKAEVNKVHTLCDDVQPVHVYHNNMYMYA